MKVKDQSMNVWKANGIPRLEFCSIERASQLLSCEVNDIYHWINMGKIYPTIYFNNHVEVNITAYISGEQINKDEAMNTIFSVVKKPSIINCYYGDLSNGKKQVNYFENATLYHENKKNLLISRASICGLWTPSFYEPWSDGLIQSINSQNSIFLPDDSSGEDVFLVANLVDMIEIGSQNLLITRDDIERIYYAGLNGHDLSYSSLPTMQDGTQQVENKSTIKSKVKKLEMEKGIYKFLFKCPHEKKSNEYKFNNEKINRTKLIECMKDKSVFLFGSEVMPLTDKDYLMPIITEVLDDLELPYTKTKTRK